MNDLLRTARENKGWSVRELARRSGVAASTISRIERAVSDPTWTTLRTLLIALDVLTRENVQAVCDGAHWCGMGGPGESSDRLWGLAERVAALLPPEGADA